MGELVNGRPVYLANGTDMGSVGSWWRWDRPFVNQ